MLTSFLSLIFSRFPRHAKISLNIARQDTITTQVIQLLLNSETVSLSYVFVPLLYIFYFLRSISSFNSQFYGEFVLLYVFYDIECSKILIYFKVQGGDPTGTGRGLWTTDDEIVRNMNV